MAAKLYVGLDVGVETTSVCVVDQSGAIVREGKVESTPKAIAFFLKGVKGRFIRVGLEAGTLSQWLYSGLTKARLPAVCVNARLVHAVIKASTNKTDKKDAQAIAQIMRFGMFRAIHVKTLASQHIRTMLNSRRLLQTKLIDIENGIRSLLRNFGLKIGAVTRLKYEGRVRELLAKLPDLRPVIDPLLIVRRALEEQYSVLQKRVRKLAETDDVCRLLMTAPGVGPLVALSFRSSVDEPDRFRRSRTIGAHFGMTPRTFQSGNVDVQLSTSRNGDVALRRVLYDAAKAILRKNTRHSDLKAWGLRIAQRRGSPKALVAISRRLAVILHRMWLDRAEFRWPEPTPATS